MSTLKLTICPRSAFGTPLAGDTLFGQLCWAIRERFGQERLTELLDGYTQGRPFVVISDGFPSGYLPKPTVPELLLGRDIDPAKRKEFRRRAWLPEDGVARPLAEWLVLAQDFRYREIGVLTQNTINRLTGTTGTGQFAPRQVERIDFGSSQLDIHCVLDDSRFTRADFRQVIEDIGQSGFGRDASTGLGKFVMGRFVEEEWPRGDGRHFLTLGPCAPASQELHAPHCYYLPLTRFGRHGGPAALQGSPFKRPVLLMRTAAFLTLKETGEPRFLGLGLGGDGTLSTTIRATVHQGYAPVVPLNMEIKT